jgi:hypothetical protein
MLIGSGFFLNLFSQNQNLPYISHEAKRTSYFFILELETEADATNLETYLASFNRKVESVKVDFSTQMCTVSFNEFTDDDIEQLIFQAGFKGIKRKELPPVGFKYVYLMDETWKLIEL